MVMPADDDGLVAFSPGAAVSCRARRRDPVLMRRRVPELKSVQLWHHSAAAVARGGIKSRWQRHKMWNPKKNPIGKNK